MVAVARFKEVEHDQHVVMRGMSWQDFEALLAIRGDRAGVRMYYLDGAIEIMSPASIHEERKKMLARLLELWALETDVTLEGYGSWTLKRELKEAGAEPDECYILGTRKKEVPDLVIEVEWSRTSGLLKHEIYRRLGVRELWTLKNNGRLALRVLEKGAWVETPSSKVLPKLDVKWLLSFLGQPTQTAALHALRASMKKKKR